MLMKVHTYFFRPIFFTLRSILFVWLNALLYAILHEGAHAVAALLCGRPITKFYIHWSGFNGFVRYGGAMNGDLAKIVTALAGSLGGGLGCYFIYVVVLYFCIKDNEPSLGRYGSRPFRLFSTLLEEKPRVDSFYSWLICITIGYYLHFNRLIYAFFPGCRSVFPFYYLGGDGSHVWYMMAASWEMRLLFFRIGVAINYMGLLAIVWKAYQAAKSYHYQVLKKP